MTYWLDEPRRRQEAVASRAFGVALGLSLLVHALALFVVLRQPMLLSPDEGPDTISEPIRVRIAAAAAASLSVPASAPRIVAAPEPARPPGSKRKPRARTAIAATVPALPQLQSSRSEYALPQSATPEQRSAQSPKPEQPPPPSLRPEAPDPTPTQAQSQEPDLWSYIQARRRERGEPTESLTPSLGADGGRLAANLAADLPQPATGAATENINRGGGIFQIKRMTYDDAAFLFFGWNPEMGRQTPQLITVRIGDNANMRIAVVRRMIAIIREYTQGDFVWRTVRHDRDLVLSARPDDNAGLEAFLLREFFDERERQ
jgi:hypothetical protein